MAPTFTVRYGGKQGKKIRLVESEEHVVVRTHDRAAVERAPLERRSRNALLPFVPVVRFPRAGVEVLRAIDRRGAKSARDAARRALKSDSNIDFAGRTLVDPHSREPVIYTENFFVKFEDDASERECRRIVTRRKLKICKQLAFARNAFFVAAKEGTGTAVFEIAEELLEQSCVALCHPELVREIRRRSAFPGQWHLADVGAEAVWPSTQGENITIAIIDDGFDIDHEEFRSAGKIVAPRDVTFGDDDPRPGSTDDHGTACAGVALADGMHGASGVAPRAKLLPIRCVSDLGSMQEAEAFQWAADNGADVISCSWGPRDGNPNNPNDPLHQRVVSLPDSTRLAIDYAVQHGRNGRGCVVLFAAGNGNESVDNDGYASYSKVIAVAACNKQGKKSWYSDFGNAIWCAFPSSDDPGPGIFTTDRSGAAGYNQGLASLGDVNGKYTNDFGGTSSACPGVAGIAALVLSRNPALRWDEVKDVIRRSCKRIDTTGGAYNAEGRSKKYGYGRANAAEAVKLAIPASVGTTAIRAASAELAIRDFKSTELPLPIADTAALRELTVNADIEHSYIGDLVVRLVPPASTGVGPITLHDRAGGATNNIKKKFDKLTTPALAKLVGKKPNGTWKLVVSDAAKLDSGKLRGFGLEMKM